MVVDGHGKNFNPPPIRTEDEKRSILPVDTEAINSMLLWFKKFDVKTGMSRILRKKLNMFSEFILKRMFLDGLVDEGRWRQDSDHGCYRVK